MWVRESAGVEFEKDVAISRDTALIKASYILGSPKSDSVPGHQENEHQREVHTQPGINELCILDYTI